MSQFNESGFKTYVAGATLGQYIRVKKTAGLLQFAGVADAELGTTQGVAYGSGNHVTVRLRNTPGTEIFIASGAITDGANVYAGADGKVAATGTILIGVAERAATADGDRIEVLRVASPIVSQSVTAVAATGSTQADAAALAYGANVVSAADATKGVVLPAASVGATVTVYSSVAALGLKVYPASTGTINNGTASAAVVVEGRTLATFVATSATNWAASFTVDAT